MRRGMTLVEIIVTLPLIAAVGMIFSLLFPVLVRDVPRLQRVVHTHGQVGTMLQRIRRDVDSARSLPASADGRTAGESQLLIELDEGVICYRIEPGRVVRDRLTGNVSRAERAGESWSLPKAKLSFRNWPGDLPAQAVEVRTAIEYTISRRTYRKLANSHVFYLGALPGSRQHK